MVVAAWSLSELWYGSSQQWSQLEQGLAAATLLGQVMP